MSLRLAPSRIYIILVRPSLVGLLGLLLISLCISAWVDVVLIGPSFIGLLWGIPLWLEWVIIRINVVVVAPSFVLGDRLDGLFVLIVCSVKVIETEIILLGLLSRRLLLGLLTASEILLVIQLFLGLLLATVLAVSVLILLI